jgi:hypothetical protein
LVMIPRGLVLLVDGLVQSIRIVMVDRQNELLR